MAEKRTSKNCQPQVQHKKGIYYFVIAGVFLIASLVVGLAEWIFGIISNDLWLGMSIFSLLGIVIGIGFAIFLILGFIAYFKCNTKEAIEEVIQ